MLTHRIPIIITTSALLETYKHHRVRKRVMVVEIYRNYDHRFGGGAYKAPGGMHGERGTTY